jgi:hypothetical protein
VAAVGHLIAYPCAREPANGTQSGFAADRSDDAALHRIQRLDPRTVGQPVHRTKPGSTSSKPREPISVRVRNHPLPSDCAGTPVPASGLSGGVMRCIEQGVDVLGWSRLAE